MLEKVLNRKVSKEVIVNQAGLCWYSEYRHCCKRSEEQVQVSWQEAGTDLVVREYQPSSWLGRDWRQEEVVNTGGGQ